MTPHSKGLFFIFCGLLALADATYHRHTRDYFNVRMFGGVAERIQAIQGMLGNALNTHMQWQFEASQGNANLPALVPLIGKLPPLLAQHRPAYKSKLGTAHTHTHACGDSKKLPEELQYCRHNCIYPCSVALTPYLHSSHARATVPAIGKKPRLRPGIPGQALLTIRSSLKQLLAGACRMLQGSDGPWTPAIRALQVHPLGVNASCSPQRLCSVKTHGSTWVFLGTRCRRLLPSASCGQTWRLTRLLLSGQLCHVPPVPRRPYGQISSVPGCIARVAQPEHPGGFLRIPSTASSMRPAHCDQAAPQTVAEALPSG